MKDILIIFTVLLLLLITISTLGGSLTFVNRSGGAEYFTDSTTTANAAKAAAAAAAAATDAKKGKGKAETFAMLPKAPAPAVKATFVNNAANNPPPLPKKEAPPHQVVEGFDGRIYATA